MSKEKLITREITYTLITVLGVNSETGESENRSYAFYHSISDDKALISCIKKNTDLVFHPAVVVAKDVMRELRGIRISDFIEHSEIVTRPPSQTRKEPKEPCVETDELDTREYSKKKNKKGGEQ